MNSTFRILYRLPLWGTLLFASPVLSAQDASLRLGIDVIVADVLAQHPELGFYEAEIAVARAGIRTAAVPNDPDLSVGIGRKRAHDVTGTLAGEGSAWSVSVAQTFEWPGRIALRKAIANRDLVLAELGYERFKAALAGRVLLLGIGLRGADEKAASIAEVAERFRALKETFLARDPSGLTPLLETRVIEAQELVLQRRATEAALERNAALIELNQLRGVPLNSPLALASSKLSFGDAPEPEAALAAARENNFEFRAARLELEQQGFAVRLARNERYPAFTISPYYERESAGEREATYGIGLSLPLPLSGRAASGIQVEQARHRQAEAALLAAERTLEREVVTAVQALAAKVAEIQRWDASAISKFREAAATADRHYRLGAVPLSTYVELQASYLEAVESLLATEREALETALQLRLLTGLEISINTTTL